ncbi:MAG: NUDIX hydrolase [Desulfomonile sp.]|nr:NUDIX hydrolase [Deltaproteobacteria bacterium]
MKTFLSCPRCNHNIPLHRNPLPTTDVVIRNGDGIVLIKRKNPPPGWAIPGGFIDYGESAEEAAIREAMEETSLEIRDLMLLGVYSKADRDPRQHTISIVFTAFSQGVPKAADDAIEVGVFTRDNLPTPLAFDHDQILDDFFSTAAKRCGCMLPG